MAVTCFKIRCRAWISPGTSQFKEAVVAAEDSPEAIQLLQSKYFSIEILEVEEVDYEGIILEK